MSALRQGPRALERWILARSPLGLVLAVLMLGATLAPSLLARTWVFQGVLSGVGLAVGYGVGVALTAVGRWVLGDEGVELAVGEAVDGVGGAGAAGVAAVLVMLIPHRRTA